MRMSIVEVQIMDTVTESLYPIGIVSALLDTTHATIHTMAKVGMLDKVKMGGRTYYRKEQVETLMRDGYPSPWGALREMQNAEQEQAYA